MVLDVFVLLERVPRHANNPKIKIAMFFRNISKLIVRHPVPGRVCSYDVHFVRLVVVGVDLP